MATAREIAEWMSEEFDRLEYLRQKDAVQLIQEKFGTDHVYTNRNRNPAIAKRVLENFKEIRPDLVFTFGRKTWRKRDPYDAPGRRQRCLTEAEYKAKTRKR
jgi:hypothetical protein